jgi:hypothetical protein
MHVAVRMHSGVYLLFVRLHASFVITLVLATPPFTHSCVCTHHLLLTLIHCAIFNSDNLSGVLVAVILEVKQGRISFITFHKQSTT